jgi:tRNA threonylcarbamoyladenosine biosynthesis protein TsaE
LETHLRLDDIEATERLAHALAPGLRPGDLVALSGGLGAGKSTFARALIADRLASLGRAEDIPSPSFTLVQTYDLDECELWHADLYRLSSAEEIAELGLADAFAQAICVVEWAERLGPSRPDRALEIALGFLPGHDGSRSLRLTATGGGWDWIPLALRRAACVPV